MNGVIAAWLSAIALLALTAVVLWLLAHYRRRNGTQRCLRQPAGTATVAPSGTRRPCSAPLATALGGCILVGGLALTVGLHHYRPLDTAGMLISWSIYGLLLATLLLLPLLRVLRHRSRACLAGCVLLLPLATTLVTSGGCVLLNGLLDTTPPRQQLAQVRGTSPGYLEVAYSRDILHIPAGPRLLAAVRPGSTRVRLAVAPGGCAYPWLVSWQLLP